jgi:hypothetical protein
MLRIRCPRICRAQGAGLTQSDEDRSYFLEAPFPPCRNRHFPCCGGSWLLPVADWQWRPASPAEVVGKSPPKSRLIDVPGACAREGGRPLCRGRPMERGVSQSQGVDRLNPTRVRLLLCRTRHGKRDSCPPKFARENAAMLRHRRRHPARPPSPLSRLNRPMVSDQPFRAA